MQVLENAVRKLKMPSHVEEVSTRIEPRFETTEDRAVDSRTTPEPDQPKSPDPIPLNAMKSDPTPKVRMPLFSELPDPVFDNAAPAATDKGGSGGGGAGARRDDGERRFGPWLTSLGAAASIALILGVSYWTYKLGQRDAREVPIVAALEGPARVAPENSGGLQVAHQGHSVNSVLEGQGVEQVASAVKIAPPDSDLTTEDAPASELSVLLASRAPVARPEAEAVTGLSNTTADVAEPLTPNGTVITAENVAGGEKSSEGEGAVVAVNASQTNAVEAVTVSTPTRRAADAETELPPQTDVAVVATPETNIAGSEQIQKPGSEFSAAKPEVEAIAEPLAISDTGQTGATEPVAQPRELELAALGPLPPLGEGSEYAPATLTSPAKRPENLNFAMATAVNAALETVLAESTQSPDIVRSEPAEQPAQPVQVAAANDLDVIPLPDGTRMIQLGAYVSEAIARQQWDRLSSQHDDLLGAKEHYIQRTNNSGKVFYRLRVAGYETGQDTRSACAALSARGLPCITVTLR